MLGTFRNARRYDTVRNKVMYAGIYETEVHDRCIIAPRDSYSYFVDVHITSGCSNSTMFELFIKTLLIPLKCNKNVGTEMMINQ